VALNLDDKKAIVAESRLLGAGRVLCTVSARALILERV